MEINTRKGYKAFKKGLICEPDAEHRKQYQENTTYEEDGGEICGPGVMHYCLNPLDCLEYYPLIGENGDLTEFCEVEALDEPVTDDVKKYASKKLHIGARFSLAKIAEAAVNVTLEQCKDAAESAASGVRGNAAASGWRGNAAASGWRGNAAASGVSGNAAASGWSGNAAASGWRGNAAASGWSGNAAASGWRGNAAASGESGNAAASGVRGNAAASGVRGNAAASGESGNAAASGVSGNAAASGWRGNAAASGERGTASATGEMGRATASGEQCVAVGWGRSCRARGAKGTYIVLAEYYLRKEAIKSARMALVDGKSIKADTWYKLENGEFVEVADDE